MGDIWDEAGTIAGMPLDRVGRTVFNVLKSEVEANNRAHGWFDEKREFAADVALLHEEVSEAWGEWVHGRDLTVYERPNGLGPTSYTMPKGDPAVVQTNEEGSPLKPVGMPQELADILIRLLDTATRHGVDLYAEYRRKMEYNKTRPHRHGGRRA